MKLIKLSSLSIFMIVLVFSCTKKNNPVGLNEGPEPTEIVLTDTSLFKNCYSYQDSLETYTNNNKIIVGNFDNAKVKSLIKFTSLPDTVESIENNQLQLTLVNKDSLNFARALKFARINQAWKENYVNWQNATDSTQWQPDAFSDIDFEYELTDWADSTIISIASEKFYNEVEGKLVVDSLIAENGIAIYAEEEAANSFVEFFSLESSFSPSLKFNYISSEADSMLTYEEEVSSDIILSEKIDGDNTEFEKFENELKISNILPVKMYMNIDFSAETMIENLQNINTTEDLRRMTINKAEIILHKQLEEQFPERTIFTLRPYVVTSEDATFPPNYYEDYTFVSYSNDSTVDSEEDKYSLDITKILQKIVAEEIDYYGLIFRSLEEDADFEFIKFATKFNNDENLRPAIRIIYTTPVLDE